MLGIGLIFFIFYSFVTQPIFIQLYGNKIANFLLQPLDITILGIMVGFEGVLVGVAIPISLQVISRALDNYQDPDLAKFFTSEPIYKSLFYSLLLHIIIVIISILMYYNPFICISYLSVWFLINIVMFIYYFFLVEKYLISLDDILLNKLNGHVDEFLEEK